MMLLCPQRMWLGACLVCVTAAGMLLDGAAWAEEEAAEQEPATRLVTITHLASVESGAVSLRTSDRREKWFTLPYGQRRTIRVAADADLEFYSGDRSRGQQGWMTIRLAAVKEIEFEVDRQAERRIWTARTFSRSILPNSIGMTLVPIPAGRFQMGSRWSAGQVASYFTRRGFREEAASFGDEHPRHTVAITKPFYLARHEVTNDQFAVFVQDTQYQTDAERRPAPPRSADPNSAELSAGNQSEARTWREAFDIWDREAAAQRRAGRAGDVPVVNLSWQDAVAFCGWLSKREGRTYRLPTEAEWEYACRSGTNTMFWAGNSTAVLSQIANVPDRSLVEEFHDRHENLGYEALDVDDGYPYLAPVGSFRANPFGVYDTHGNVWEWCADYYDASYYARSPAKDPLCRTPTQQRVARGGCFL